MTDLVASVAVISRIRGEFQNLMQLGSYGFITAIINIKGAANTIRPDFLHSFVVLFTDSLFS